MLSTIRQFAADRLIDAPEREEVSVRHASVFLDLAESVDTPGGLQRAALDRVETELDNVRRAFEWCLETGEPGRVADAMWRSWWFWWTRGYVTEGKLWADRCLAAPGLPRAQRRCALGARAMLAIWTGEYDRAVTAFDEAAGVAHELGDARTIAYADVGIGLVRALTTSLAEGRAAIRRGVEAFEAMGDDAGATIGLAAQSWVQGITREFEDADASFVDALDRARRTGSDLATGITLSALAQRHIARAEPTAAYEPITTALEHLAGTRLVGATILTLEVVAELGLRAQHAAESMELLGATAAIRAAMGTRVPPQAAARLAALHEEGRSLLGADAATATGRGAAMGFPEAVDQARRLLARLRADAA
jgi:non-specific serine/threonine protein kinase